jgi:peptidoglycan L-alanyl-D-glutamate endopeptidase CwlK
MRKYLKFTVLFSLLFFYACKSDKKEIIQVVTQTKKEVKDTAIVDCNYTFEEAVYGSKAPEQIINELQLIEVQYYSTDGKLHKGQIVTNKELAGELKEIFAFILKTKFPVAQVIPIVAYNWNDQLSMRDNNSYSFCYRNASFSKHATGMAIDINPFFNPMRWKEGYENRINKPIGAIRDTTINGTFYSSHPVVQEFIRLGFMWGHSFKAKYDDHHFEK